jgi:hypothetical protein
MRSKVSNEFDATAENEVDGVALISLAKEGLTGGDVDADESVGEVGAGLE